MKKKVTPVRARSKSVGASFISKRILQFCLAFLLKSSETRKSPPAMRNLKVAIAIGVRASFNVILTITNELPQKVISVSIREMLKRLIAPVFIDVVLFSRLISSSVEEDSGQIQQAEC